MIPLYMSIHAFLLFFLIISCLNTKQELGNKYSKTTAYETEPVTYSLDKKSATVIKVDANGNVTPLKRGTATVTIKTLSNKSAKVKIVVE